MRLARRSISAYRLSPMPYGLMACVAGASVVLGGVALAAPGRVAELLGEAELVGHKAGDPYYRFLGLRDIVVGTGLCVGLRSGSVRPWLLSRAASDLLDVATIGLPAIRRGWSRRLLTGLGLPLASIAVSLGLWVQLRARRAPELIALSTEP